MSSNQPAKRFAFRALLLATAIAFPTVVYAQAGKQPAGKGVAAQPASAKSQSNSQPDGPLVAAVVNGVSISMSDLAQQCRRRFGDEVLEDMVNKTIILQACQSQNIVITDRDIDNEVSRIATKFNLSTKMYLKLIEDERGISQEQYAADIIWPMLALRALAKDSISVTPAEIDQEFQGEFGAKVKVRMIACKDRNKIAQIHQQVVAKPDSFKQMAKEHSEDPTSASVEGLLPPIRHFSGDDELEKIAFSLAPNEVSKIFPAGEFHVILQCVQHLAATNPPGPQMQEIQNRIKADIEDRKLRESAETVYLTLRESAAVTLVHGNADAEKQYPNVAAIVNRQSIPMESYDKACVKRYGKKIIEGEINRKLIETALSKGQLQVTQNDLNAEIARSAEYFGYTKADGSPDVERWLQNLETEEDLKFDLYMQDVIWPTVALKKLTLNQVQVTNEDLQKGFEANYGPRAEVLAVVLSNQRTAQQVWEMARSNKTEQFFGELASQYSVEDSSRSNFGKVPPLRKHGGQPNLEKAAFELAPGEISGIIEVNGRYIILRSQGFTKPVVTDFNAVKDEIYKDILEKKHRLAMDQYLRKLIEGAEIANYLEPKKSRANLAELPPSDAPVKR